MHWPPGLFFALATTVQYFTGQSTQMAQAQEITLLNLVGEEIAEADLYVLRYTESRLRRSGIVPPTVSFKFIQSQVADDAASGVGIAAQRWCSDRYHAIIGVHCVSQRGSDCELFVDGYKHSDSDDKEFPVDIRFDKNSNVNATQVQEALLEAKQKSKVILVVLGKTPNSARSLLIEAHQLNMTSGDFVFLIPGLFDVETTTEFPWQKPGGDDGLDNVAQEAYKAALVGSNYSLLSDAMYAYGAALNRCLVADPLSYLNGQLICNCSKNLVFKGSVADVAINSNGNRGWKFEVYSMDPEGRFSRMLSIDLDDVKNCPFHNATYSFNHKQSCVFLNRPVFFCGNYLMPSDPWSCNDRDDDSEECVAIPDAVPVNRETTITICLFVVLSVLVLLVIGHLYRTSQAKKSEKRAFQTVIVQSSEVKLHRRSSKGGQQELENNQHRKSTSSSANSWLSGDMVQALLNNEPVLVKQFLALEHVQLKDKDLKLLLTISSLNHENCVQFIGVTVRMSEPSLLFLWGDPGLKGTIKDICATSDIELDPIFKASLIRDMINGLVFISKSPIRFHGCLNPVTCLVTNRWMVKLSGFGTNRLTAPLCADRILEVNPKAEPEILPYVAPELRTRTSCETGAMEADIYALAGIIYLVYYRCPADMNKHAAIAHIYNESDGTETWANSMLKSVCVCWSLNPSKRPSIADLEAVVKRLTICFRGKNMVDHMFSMLEKYANNLESLVQERTAQLEEERCRADRLLYQMLPPAIAEQLKQGNAVFPESFDSVTVYFSDIVGFTEIASRSSAIQVVGMLNSLYQQFDEIIQNHDCYKVETIGDAYLVVSGAPTRNGDKHITAVANMAFEVSAFIKHSYKIPHLPCDRVSIRIGFHSGPIAAGVIGFTAPRYCLFGDTVNVASRMESNGKHRIHISWSSFELLNIHDYIIVPRGEIHIKGKGLCRTYWLEEPEFFTYHYSTDCQPLPEFNGTTPLSDVPESC